MFADSRSAAYRSSTYCESSTTGVPGQRRRISIAARTPSSVKPGGIRTSIKASSGRCSATAANSPSASPASAATWNPPISSTLIRPTRNNTESSAITARTAAPR
ncbi:hypothetical protein GCM10010195_02920 [Kitasatospora griseola]|nr:hypothetical protein GCM10010195_02920 [Kitasatospora griseola]